MNAADLKSVNLLVTFLEYISIAMQVIRFLEDKAQITGQLGQLNFAGRKNKLILRRPGWNFCIVNPFTKH